MNFAIAHRINSAAACIGMALLGLVESVDVEDVRTIRAVSLGQMQSAAEVIEAHNAGITAGRGGIIYCTCEARLLANVKAYADHIEV